MKILIIPQQTLLSEKHYSFGCLRYKILIASNSWGKSSLGIGNLANTRDFIIPAALLRQLNYQKKPRQDNQQLS